MGLTSKQRYQCLGAFRCQSPSVASLHSRARARWLFADLPSSCESYACSRGVSFTTSCRGRRAVAELQLPPCFVPVARSISDDVRPSSRYVVSAQEPGENEMEESLLHHTPFYPHQPAS